MEIVLNNFLFVSSLVLLLSIFLSKSSTRFGLPILVLFLFVGILAGSEGIGGIHFENYELTHTLSLIALCLIIFSGGIETNFNEVRPHLYRGILLSSFGVIFTTAVVGLFSFYTLKMPLLDSMLLGAILSATDAAAVFSIFKDRKAQVLGPTKTILKFESGSNDPMAYFLVTLLYGMIEAKGNINANDTILVFILNPIIGIICGHALSKAFVYINNKINLEHLGLYPALTLAFLFLAYSGTTKLGGNGFLSVYIFGITVGNQKIVHENVLFSFYDGISWLSQIGLFVMLGLLVFPSRLMEIAFPALVLASFLILIARPMAVFLCLIGSKFKLNEKIFISWAGLKGASPIVFASFAATHAGESVHRIFDIVFFVVLVSALVQGSTLKWFAHNLSLLEESIEDPEYPINMESLEKMKNGIFEYHISQEDYAVDKKVIDLKLPPGTWILFLKRKGTFIIPDGATTLNENDKALVVTKNKDDINIAKSAFQENKLEYEDTALEDSISEIESPKNKSLSDQDAA